jgi:hypothetical protein
MPVEFAIVDEVVSERDEAGGEWRPVPVTRLELALADIARSRRRNGGHAVSATGSVAARIIRE